ncbi:MAG: fumarylacetoacetase [Pseudomonadota bacterium]|jgi:fumarylacetoacetase
MIELDDTHDPARTSWLASANTPDCDFPLQNLPFGRFMLPQDHAPRLGVAIGDCVLDLAVLGHDAPADMTELLTASAASRRTLRALLCRALTQGSPRQGQYRAALYPLNRVRLLLPCAIENYTDFYAGIHHARAVGSLFRPDAPLLPNYHWVPIAYHGRASSLLPSGSPVKRPLGQVKHAAEDSPQLRPTAKLDFELEVGIIIGRPNDLGSPIPIDEAASHIFGLTLLNDWSARDIQAWEYQPLGPFLAKNFATTLSPWIVTLEALAPFHAPLARPEEAPTLPYLDHDEDRRHGAFEIALEVSLSTARMRQAGETPARITSSHFARAAYWSAAQMVAHHTINGCNLRPGDLLGSGTLSGPTRDQAGSLIELTEGGKTAITLPNGEARRFLEDGDQVIFTGKATKDGFRSIGFGACVGEILPCPQYALPRD